MLYLTPTTRPFQPLEIPTVDISYWTHSGIADKKLHSEVLKSIRAACLDKGFFLITGHGISRTLQADMFRQAKMFFSLPQEEKLKVDEKLGWGKSHRGYQVIGGEGYQEGKLPDLKEGFQYGNHKSLDHPDTIAERMLCGPNQWPSNLPGFVETMELYFETIRELALKVLRLLAGSLQVDYDKTFGTFATDAASAVRLLHYPPQRKDSHPDQLGTGAHTDFGGITLLMTDDVSGLQVFDESAQQWIGIEPNPDAYIINLGDVFQRMTGGHYKSSLHRVINHTPIDRYSIPYFFDGNLDTVLHPIVEGTHVDRVLTVEEHMLERMTTTRSRGKTGAWLKGDRKIETV